MAPRRDEVLARLRESRAEWLSWGIAELELFGSVARDEATEDSDVDLLVQFSEPVGLFGFQEIRDRLTDLLGHPVDLVPRGAVKAAIRDAVYAEAIRAA